MCVSYVGSQPYQQAMIPLTFKGTCVEWENAIFPIETKKQSINQSLAKATEWRSERETERTERENGEGRDHYDVLGGPRRYREEDRALVRGARRPFLLLHRQGELCFHFVSVVLGL